MSQFVTLPANWLAEFISSTRRYPKSKDGIVLLELIKCRLWICLLPGVLTTSKMRVIIFKRQSLVPFQNVMGGDQDKLYCFISFVIKIKHCPKL